MTHGVTVALAALGIAGQALIALLVLAAGAALLGRGSLLAAIRRLVWGYELWLAFLIAALATGGSLFFSEIAGFVPCELCWYQRICMYPVSVIALLAALANDHRVARYLLSLPIVGAGISTYHVLVENGVVGQTQACQLSAPGGCATKWVDQFGYVTIPVLTLTGFALVLAFLILATLEPGDSAAEGS
ncbi:MAG: disulfide bond formation protein B [Actinomycetes bacterium]